MDQCARAGLDDIGRCAVTGERLAVDLCLQKYLTYAVTSRRHRAKVEALHLDMEAQDLTHGSEGGGDRPIAGSARGALPGPGTGHPHLGGGGDVAADHP